MKFNRFISAIFLVGIIDTLALRFKFYAGWSPDIVLVTLMMLAFFLDLDELVTVTGLSVWVVNWIPRVSSEMVLLALLPFIAFAIKKFSPWEGWLSAAVLSALGVLILYGVSNFHAFSMFGFFAFNVVISASFGVIIFLLFRVFYPTSRWRT